MNTPTHTEVHRQLMTNQKRFNLLRGGTRSGKTWALMQMAFEWLMAGSNVPGFKDTGQMDIVRDTLPALKMSFLKDFETYIDLMGVRGEINHSKTDRRYEYNGREIIFYPTTDEQRLKGKKRDYCIINEADGVSYYDFIQIRQRTTERLWLDYNPSDPDSWIRTKLEEEKTMKDRVNLMVSTYKMNPFLSKEQIQDIEDLKHTDKGLYEVYALGNWNVLTGLVFPNFGKLEDLPREGGKVAYGLDFGFTNDPTALIEVRKIDRALYIRELLYKSNMLTSDLIHWMDKHLKSYQDIIIADSSDPKAIEEIKKATYRIRRSKKGPDSIRKGIDTVKQYKIFVDAGSENLITEFRRYKWKVDKDGEPLNEPIDKYNHCSDALRYAMEYLHRSPSQVKFI